MIGFHIESHAPTKSHISKQRQTVRWIKCFSCVCLRLLSIKLISLAFFNFRNRPSDAFLSSLFITHESYLLLSQYWKEFNHTNINPKKNICLIETHTHTHQMWKIYCNCENRNRKMFLQLFHIMSVSYKFASQIRWHL